MIAGDESHGNRIDAVASVLGGHTFTMENMSQVAAAIPANNFGAMSVRVLMTINGFGDFIIEAGPTAMAFELVVGSVKRRVAPSANKRARIFQIRVLAGEWLLRAFANDDTRFFRRQFVELRSRLIGIHECNSFSVARRQSIRFHVLLIVFECFARHVGMIKKWGVNTKTFLTYPPAVE